MLMLCAVQPSVAACVLIPSLINILFVICDTQFAKMFPPSPALVHLPRLAQTGSNPILNKINPNPNMFVGPQH